MATPVAAAKQQLRNLIKKRLAGLSPDVIQAQSRAVFETLQASPQYKEAKRISIYLAMPAAEVQTEAIVRHALIAGKQVFVPYLHKSTLSEPDAPARIMDMVQLRSIEDYESLGRDKWGIPSIGADAVAGRERILGDSPGNFGPSPATLDLMLVPGVAFNADPEAGIRRLGHGKGFYDFFLNRYFARAAEHGGHGSTLRLTGLALTEQWLNSEDGEVPMGRLLAVRRPGCRDDDAEWGAGRKEEGTCLSRELSKICLSPINLYEDILWVLTYQKTSWGTIIGILQSKAEPEAILFAAITLRGKITYDISTQVPATELPALRNQILLLLKQFAVGPKPIRVQLCVCLAILAIQMKDWNDVLPSVVQSLSDSPESHACILDFLRVLPEEVTEGRKITLSEDDLADRSKVLLADNTDRVVQLLINYSQSSPAAARNPQLMECITSWLREVPVGSIINSPLLDVVFHGVTADECSQEASECLCVMLRETRDVDESQENIQLLFPRIIGLQPRIAIVAGEEDAEALKALTKVLATAAESWSVAIARQPSHFRPLVEAVLECAARDKDQDVIEHTFLFWYELKQYLVLERYIQSRVELVDVYSKLVDILLKHLQYPRPESGNEADLFDGDREQEEKFREFRHQMGDTLKDACEVMGVTECLTKVLNAIQVWMQNHASQVSDTNVPNWQELEAPLFAMRALGRIVDREEEIVLPQLMPLLVQIPNHEKLKFATIMVLGRYTEWTAVHPEYLEPQFNYIVNSFQADSKEIVRAAALAIKFFCTDCRNLLSGQVLQLQTFYDQVLDKLPNQSKEEVTDGVSSVVAVQPADQTYTLLKTYCDPLIQRLMAMANQATDKESKIALAEHLQLITVFVQNVTPAVNPGDANPAVKYWQEVFPILSTVLENFLDFSPICERICRCWRNMIVSYRTAMAPLLPEMANKLASGFTASREGCFLWVTGTILREFSEDRDSVDQATTENIYSFFEAQATAFLRVMTELQPADLPDAIDDFFRLMIDALLYYPQKLIPSTLLVPIFEAAIYALTLEQRDPLVSTLHYVRDLLSYGSNNPATSEGLPEAAAQHIKGIILNMLQSHGLGLVKQVMAGMMLTFPRDCFADGSGVLLALFEMIPGQTAEWVAQTIQLLPEGTVNAAEANRLMAKIKERLSTDDASNLRHVRVLLQDFTNSYRRRNVAPRDGLGQLEARRFQFSG
ncbi:Armadillo-type fold domain containing protein [Cordyceps fumosorosea ARSEF 2679]|uniref:Armadillo-type fold domain containing protein n=1 Tax=Cordyceps fumosorosea (strain ARSEF 2679) TaxID=1081104 RepID=A0A167WP05_CORFA|nr:Armadillo-type fold domain containing protein [Cordyceps fumosorosea ARSEF 2679]OAA64031.1 Armadillo-type fold domain containing protein [Cordyceps fumosorosea ARSEF 2679]